MPVVATVTVSYVLIALEIDMLQLKGHATLRRFVDGNAAGDMDFYAVGDEFTAMVGAIPAAGKSRGDDITDAVYAFALEKGYISGAVT